METVEIVKIYPTEVWYEKDFFGTVLIKMQHQGMEPFTFMQMHYDYAYTSNSHQHHMVKEVGKLLGIDDIQQREWVMPKSWMPAEQNNECGCYNCMKHKKDSNGLPLTASTFIVCPECGNKRCPRATDHSLPCTNSNEPGQPGSRY